MSNLSIKRLSYKKIEVEYQVPLVTNFEQGRNHPWKYNGFGPHQIVKIRYTQDPKNKNVYHLIRGSVNIYLENLHFKYKVGKSIPHYGGGYTINSISPSYSRGFNTIFEGRTISLTEFLEQINIADGTFVNVIREKKLEEILG